MQLKRGDVVAGALALLDVEGLDGLTMRKLAASLDVQAGALYWHFENKQALLDAMADKLVEGVGAAVEPASWDEQITVLAGRLRRAFLAHRDGARVVAGTFVAEPNTLLAGKVLIEVLCGAGVPVDRAGWITFALAHYVLGHTIEEQAQAELAGRDEWDTGLMEASGEEDPLLVRAHTSVMTADPAERFAYGLQIFVDGIRRQLAEVADPAEPGIVDQGS